MKIKMISYSLTGNNGRLADSLAARISADHTSLKDMKTRSNGQIAREMLFGGIPETIPSETGTEDADLLLFVGPVWMGQPASPFRKAFKGIRERTVPYAYISVSGGALGPNRRLSKALEKRTGSKPEAVVDLQIARLFLDKDKPAMKDTSAYVLSPEEAERLSDMVIDEIGDLIEGGI